MSKAWETYESEKRIEGFSLQTLKAYRLQAALLTRYFVILLSTSIYISL
ncbi:hypothetical protein ACPCXA_04695 [Lysinibacillus agricola]